MNKFYNKEHSIFVLLCNVHAFNLRFYIIRRTKYSRYTFGEIKGKCLLSLNTSMLGT
jgi:hypothetical protein